MFISIYFLFLLIWLKTIGRLVDWQSEIIFNSFLLNHFSSFILLMSVIRNGNPEKVFVEVKKKKKDILCDCYKNQKTDWNIFMQCVPIRCRYAKIQTNKVRLSGPSCAKRPKWKLEPVIKMKNFFTCFFFGGMSFQQTIETMECLIVKSISMPVLQYLCLYLSEGKWIWYRFVCV